MNFLVILTYLLVSFQEYKLSYGLKDETLDSLTSLIPTATATYSLTGKGKSKASKSHKVNPKASPLDTFSTSSLMKKSKKQGSVSYSKFPSVPPTTMPSDYPSAALTFNPSSSPATLALTVAVAFSSFPSVPPTTMPSDYPSAALTFNPSSFPATLAPTVTIMNFDNFIFASVVGFIPGYNGFDFNQTLYGIVDSYQASIDEENYDEINSGLEKGCISPPNVALFRHEGAFIAAIEDGTFTVVSLYITPLYDTIVYVNFEGYDTTNNVIATQTVKLESQNDTQKVVFIGFENLMSFYMISEDNVLVIDDVMIFYD